MAHLTTANTGVALAYETFGDPDHPALLLVIGFQAQLVGWDDDFCRQLAGHGRYVIRFDNRDIGRSTKHTEAVDIEAAIAALQAGTPYDEAPYSLSDLALDAVGLLDGLGIEAAHIVGGSMGGMIAHHIAIEHPERVLSLTSLMSTSLEPEFLPPPEVFGALLETPPADRDEAIAATVAVAELMVGPRYFDADYVARFFAISFDRGLFPESVGRQLAAMAASGSCADGLRKLETPTLVVHGTADPLIPWPAGQRTAELIPGAHLLLLDGVGHDLPPALFPLISGAIASHTDGRTR